MERRAGHAANPCQSHRQRDGLEQGASFFTSDIQAFSQLPAGAPSIAWCLEHYVARGSKSLDPAVAQRWSIFLGQPESIAAQVQIASSGVLAHAQREVAAYAPSFVNLSTRPVAFFFDLGHTVPPVPEGQTK